MNTEKLIKFFTTKLEMIPELRELNNYRASEFETWWNTIRSTCERMGSTYAERASRIRFSPGMLIGGADNSAAYSRAYRRGLDSAEAFMNSVIEELEMWGFANEDGESSQTQASNSEGVVLNLTISQHQAQQITQTINLSQYDEDVQSKVQELLEELKKQTKDSPKIINIVKWLADKGSDALISILLAATNLT